jgi:MSHA pilin protein MshC
MTRLSPRQTGFTLVELVVVIILLGILSVYAAPRLFGVSGVAAYSVQDELLSSLRLTQIRAMNRSGKCNRWMMSASRVQQVSLDQDAGSCASSFPANMDDATAVTITSEQRVTLSISTDTGASYLDFDNMGRADQCETNGCTIEINGEDQTRICIETEGYIHEC